MPGPRYRFYSSLKQASENGSFLEEDLWCPEGIL